MTGQIFALIAAVFWALHVIYARKGHSKNIQSASPMDPMIGLFITIFINNVINFFVMGTRHFISPPDSVEIMGVIMIGIVGVSNSFVGRGLLFLTVSILGAARTGLMRATMPVFVLFGGVFVLGERFPPTAWIGISIVFASLFLMSVDTVLKEGNSQKDLAPDTVQISKDRRRMLKGLILGLGTAMLMGSGSILRKAGVDTLGDTILAVAIDSFAALLACVTVLLIRGKGPDILRAIRKLEFNYAMSGVFASAGLYAMMYSLSLIPVAITNSITATEPLFIIIIVWLMKEGRKEKLNLATLVFGILMVTGTIILIGSGV
jgi:drug/metabolite transporter (DMT)-like permease